MTDTDYADDLALLKNTPNHTESKLHSPGEAARDIDLYMNVNKRSSYVLNKMVNIYFKR